MSEQEIINEACEKIDELESQQAAEYSKLVSDLGWSGIKESILFEYIQDASRKSSFNDYLLKFQIDRH